MKSYWTVRYTIPVSYTSDGSKKYNQNDLCGVVADTIDDAIAKIRSEFPEATIFSVNHQGNVKFIV